MYFVRFNDCGSSSVLHSLGGVLACSEVQNNIADPYSSGCKLKEHKHCHVVPYSIAFEVHICANT